MNQENNFIGIEYEEFEPNNYSKVYLHYGGFNVEVFEWFTGDIVLDFENAMKKAKTNGLATYYSSTVDDFLNDNYLYEYREKVIDGILYTNMIEEISSLKQEIDRKKYPRKEVSNSSYNTSD